MLKLARRPRRPRAGLLALLLALCAAPLLGATERVAQEAGAPKQPAPVVPPAPKQQAPANPPAAVREKPREAPVVAVLPLRALGVAAGPAAALEATLRNEVAALPEVQLAPSEAVQAALRREPDCLARIACAAAAAAKAGARQLISGTVSELGDAYMLDLKLVDARTAQELRRATHPVSGRQEMLIELLRATAVELLAPARFTGQLVVQLTDPTSAAAPASGAPAPGPAELFVDGKPAGTLPLPGPLTGLSPGQHTLRVAKPGYHDATIFVEVRFDRTTEAHVDLERGSLAAVAFLREAERPGAAGSPVPGPPLLLAGPSEPRPRAPWLKIGGWSGLGLGAVIAVAGIAVHAKAYATAADLNRRADQNLLSAADARAYEDVSSEVNTARILYLLGGVLGAGGAGMLLWDRHLDRRGDAQLSPFAGTHSAGLQLRGRF